MPELFSFHPTKRAAGGFSRGLIRGGAEGVHVGSKTSAGYPVFSEVSGDVAERSLRAHRQKEKAVSQKILEGYKEEYDYETGDVPVLTLLGALEVSEESPVFTKRDLLRVAREELRRSGLRGVGLVVSKYQGTDEASPYADATVQCREVGGSKQYRVLLHPILLYCSEESVRETVKHEADHILRGEV